MTIQQYDTFEPRLAQMNATSKLVKAWESKNAKNAAKAGGVSLMALSLAACGGSSTTVTTPVVDTPVVDTPVVDTPVVVTPVALALTAETNILTSTDFTTGADTITATQATYGDADVIVEGTDGDGDTLTITTNADITATPTVVGIENIVVNSSQFAGAADGIDFAADGIANGTLTLNNVQAGSADDTATVTGAGNITVVAGTSVDILDVTMVEDATTSVDAGEATSVTVTAVGADQVANITVNGDAAVDAAVATDLNITATAAADVTFDLTVSTAVDTITGDANTTLVAANDVTDFDALTITGVAGVEAAGGAADLTGVDATITITDATVSTLEVADGANLVAGAAAADLTIAATDDADDDTDTEQTVTVTAGAASTGAADLSIALADDASGDGIGTVNLVVSEDMDSAGTADGDVVFTGGATLDETLNISGDGDIDLDLVAGVAGEITVNAAALTGNLVTEATAGVASVTGGSGDDTITITAAGGTEADATLAGGDGTDTLVVSGPVTDVTGMTLSGFDVITGDFEVLASQVHNAAFVVTAGSSINLDVAATSIDITTIDLSGMTFADATDVVTVDLTQIDPAIVLAGAGFNYTGSDAVDDVTGSDNADTISGGAGADVIDGGAGVDTITGGAGIDTITGGAGADTLTGGLGADTFVFDTVILAANANTITDFEADDDILQFDATTFDNYTNGGTAVIADVATVEALADDASADDEYVIIDTAANIAAMDVTAELGGEAFVAIASDTGAIYYADDGDGADIVQIGTITAAEVGDILAANFSFVA